MKKTCTLFLLLFLLVPSLIFAQNSRTKNAAAERSWQQFYTAFSAAVNKRDRAALKRMMARHFELHGGGVDGTSAEWIRTIDAQNGWRGLQQSVASGTKLLKLNRRPARVTNDDYAIFEFGVDGKWRWTGIMGD